MEDRCVVCGAIVPEGRMVCAKCCGVNKEWYFTNISDGKVKIEPLKTKYPKPKHWLRDLRTQKLLKQHQKEWDKIKLELEKKGANGNEIVEEYSKYLELLICTRDSWCGACFPSIWGDTDV